MTLIIGMKYKEGIVLIGDRKVTEDPENHHFENKIEAYPQSPFNFLVGGAGMVTLYKEFNRKIKDLTKFKINNIKNSNLSVADHDLYFYSADGFSDDCLATMKPLMESGRILMPINPLEILIGVYGDKPLLFTLSPVGPNGFKTEGDYTAIGSGGPLTLPLLKEKYKQDMSLEECVAIGTFLIKYAERFGNAAVGVEKGNLPSIFIITKDKCEEYLLPFDDKNKLLEKTEQKIKKVEEALGL